MLDTSKPTRKPQRGYVILSQGDDGDAPRFFVRWQDDGPRTRPVWASRRSQATPLSAGEAAVEVQLLAPTQPGRTMFVLSSTRPAVA